MGDEMSEDEMSDERRMGPPEFSRNGERKIYDRRKVLKISTFESCSNYWVSFLIKSYSKSTKMCKLSVWLTFCKPLTFGKPDR